MIRFALPALAVGLALSGCGSGASSGDDVELIVSDTCQCADLYMDGDTYMLDDKAYSGICVEYFPDSRIPYMSSTFSKGERRTNHFYDRYGKLTHEEKSTGNEHIKPRTCACSELEEKKEQTVKGQLSVFTLKGSRFSGTCESYYPDGETLAARRAFRNGNLHGKVEVFSKQGDLLTIQYFEEGFFVKEEIP
jgi:hypothetical protein